jgi:hypothetical protein
MKWTFTLGKSNKWLRNVHFCWVFLDLKPSSNSERSMKYFAIWDSLWKHFLDITRITLVFLWNFCGQMCLYPSRKPSYEVNLQRTKVTPSQSWEIWSEKIVIWTERSRNSEQKQRAERIHGSMRPFPFSHQISDFHTPGYFCALALFKRLSQAEHWLRGIQHIERSDEFERKARFKTEFPSLQSWSFFISWFGMRLSVQTHGAGL